MSGYRIQGFINMFVGTVMVLQAALRPSHYATRFSSLMFVGAGVILFASGVGLVLVREGRAAHDATPPDRR